MKTRVILTIDQDGNVSPVTLLVELSRQSMSREVFEIMRAIVAIRLRRYPLS